MKIAALEGLLFLVGDHGLTIEEISKILELSKTETENLIKELESSLQHESRGIMLQKFGTCFKLTTKKEYANYYQKLTELTSLRTLSQSALETLAIIAYNEPVTRLEVDELRGVSSSQMIRNLVAKDLICEVGRSSKLGRPILYGITDQFLDYFGLESKQDLPKITIDKEKFNEEAIDLYDSKYREDRKEEEIEEL